MAVALLKPATAKGETTRRRLLAAAEHQFGEKGFHGASISSITLRAGAAQGTFYLYFRSKEEIFLTLVQDIGHQLRAQSTTAINKAKNRMEAERLGLPRGLGELMPMNARKASGGCGQPISAEISAHTRI